MMIHKQNRTFLFVLPLLLLVAVVIWACSGSTQPQAAAPAAQVQEAAAPAVVENEAAPAAVVDNEVSSAESTAAENATETAASESAATVRRFAIEQSQSQATFTLDEELMGAPKTVVGATSLVEGEITVDLADMTKTTLSAIRVDARNFATDSRHSGLRPRGESVYRLYPYEH
jgi:hypothetical protein